VTKFEEDTALTQTAPGTFAGSVSPDWRIIIGANGGHIAAMLLRSMVLTVGEPERSPRVLNVHFARPPKEEPFEINTVVEREGRTMSNLSARMTQQGKLIAIGMGAFSTPREATEFADLQMPEVALPQNLERVKDRDDFPFGRQLDIVRALGPMEGERSDRAELGVWMRLRDSQVADHLVATQLMDAFAPAVFAKLGLGGGGAGVPTVEMTYYYREELPLSKAAPDDWYLGVFRTTTSRGGFIEEDGWLWHQSGTLVGQSRQLAVLRT
jgi:acyl-CoA thioesterase